MVERAELESGTGRARTYARVIHEGGSLAASFVRKTGQNSPGDVLVIRWSRPLAWNDTADSRKIVDSTARPLSDDTIRPVEFRQIQEERRR
ncbi:MAG: hypothetical protein ACKO5E_02045 [bacterium]